MSTFPSRKAVLGVCPIAANIPPTASSLVDSSLVLFSFNPVSVLTEATLRALAQNADSHKVLLAMMGEAEAIGRKLGVTFTVDAAERIAMGGRVGPHRSSMLQDLDAGRPLELDALLGAVLELSDWVGVPAPTLSLVYSLVRCRAAQQGL